MDDVRRFVAILGLVFLPMLFTAPALARSGAAEQDSTTEQTYIVVLKKAPLAEWHRQRVDQASYSPRTDSNRQAATKGGRVRLDAQSKEAQDYLRELDRDFEAFKAVAVDEMGREVQPGRRFRVALNGFSMRMTAAEAQRLSQLPEVRFVEAERNYRPQTDAGPQWLGAGDLWLGAGSLPQTQGEGIIIGIIDSGIDWDHNSFNESAGSFTHTNPLGSQKGLCSDSEVMCNKKLIGVYSFIEDNPDTADIDEHAKGKDDSGHGTHVASTAAGIALQVNNNGIPFQMSGVAPHANLISYKVCTDGDPNDPDDDTCPGTAILAAIDQAVTDGVDVINYSLGASNPGSPWNDSGALAYLSAFGAGVFVATSASNDGPADSTIGSPAQAPWITSVGNASHNRLFGSVLENLTGGDTTPPPDIFGASLTGTSGFRTIVHASDFGNALCGTGTEELGTACNDNTGATNPFPPGTFNGEIVVCDRGQYGRIEKSKNLQLAGAAGMILANTDEQGESIVAAEFCIPGIHIGDLDGDDLRSWLETGSNHKGNITGFDRIIDNALGDRVSSSSSRGPNPPPAQDIMKPNVIAPGTSILGAYTPTPFIFLSGTSMASPHIAGAAALLLGTDNSMTPSMISSALELTAAPELATDFDGSFATPHERGAGRPILRDAANNGIYFNETEAGFISANPAIGGVPRDLNLPSLTDAACEQQCSFTRTVTDRAGGRSWTATAEGFPAGVVSTVSPASFTLGNGGSRELQFNFDLRNADVIGSWVYGNIVLRSSGLPDAVMPVVLFATGGELPVEWEIFASQDSGWQDFELQGLINMPQATFTSGGLVAPQATSQNLPQDPTNLEPYDGGSGIFTVWHSVTEEDLWLHTRTSSPTAPDVDLYVGIDANRDGVADEEEEICSSTTPFDAERCDILNPTPGDYWIIVQNWTSGPSNNDQLDLVSAVVGPDSGSGLVATGPGMTQGGEPFDVRVSWNNINALEGEELLGAVGFGTSADKPANIGVIPLFWSRLNVGAAKTLPLVEGREHRFVVGPNGMHDRAFIDIPPGATSLNITASGGDSVQNAGLSLALHRVEFDDAFSEAPLAAPAPAGTPVASASGSSGGGPVLEVSGGSLQPGRWYVVVSNSNPNSSAVSLRADVESSGQKVPVKGNLLISVNRGGISQGIDYQPVGAAHGLIWYTYYDNHKPAWYLASGIADDSNFWSGSLLRFTNDGAADRFERVGVASVTMLDNTDSIFSWTLFGESGSERMGLVTGQDANPCPQIGGQATSISGFWGRAQAGLGGASVLLTDAVHAEIHYLYDGGGYPVWLQAAGANGDGLTMTQFEGDCPTCATTSVSSTNVGVLTPEFSSAMNGQWNQDYTLVTPLAGQVDRDDMVVKISSIRACD